MPHVPLSAVSVMLLGLLASSAAAATVHYATDFEAPTFTAGQPLAGQDGWLQFDGAPPSATISVETGIGRDGAQGMRFAVSGTQGSNDFTDVWTIHSIIDAAHLAANPLVTIQWDMRRPTPAPGTRRTEYWGIGIVDAEHENRIVVLVGEGLDGPYVTATNPLDYDTVGAVPDLDEWTTYAVRLNYTDSTYTVWANGGQVGPTLSFVGNDIAKVYFSAVYRGHDAAYFDNFTIISIPEPAGLSLLAMAAIVLVRRRGRT